LSLVVAAVALSLFVFSYLYLRAGAAQWPPADIGLPNLFFPSISTVLLLVSAVPAFLAERSIRRGNQGGLVLGLAGVFGAGLAFVGLQVAEYASLNFSHVTNAYGSAFFLLTWYVTFLTFIALVIGGVVQVQAWLGYFSRYRFVAIQNLVMLWYFIIVAWLIVFGVIYLSPYLLARP
ncbi:MAG: heme-copper oxidase subunit III, partial [Chloroflexota bacterium]